MDRRPPLPLITSLPTGLWLFSLGADLMYRSGRGPASWDDVAFVTMFAGLIVALLTAVPMFLDELAGTRAPRTPSRVLGVDLGIVGLYVLNVCVRASRPTAVLPVLMSFAAIPLLVATGWLGGEMADPRGAAGAVRSWVRDLRVEMRRRRAPRTA